MANKIITISREFGSGGRTIGRQAAQRLGIPCYDAELIEKIAEESGLAGDYIKEKGEHSVHANPLANIFMSDRSHGGFSMQDYLWNVQRQVICDIADKESCVIVGRCADYILRERQDLLTVFIHADMEKRVERIEQVYGEDADTPTMRRVRDKDKRRKTYHRFYTDEEWGRAQNYHICLDSGVLGIDTCTDILCGLYGR
ncbi:MAG: cytidylate kinase-like family protein [Lachnospiraceae bacterium]|nr:cytidylate kinase-like family protein [Lachnospiraceae bacterium]